MSDLVDMVGAEIAESIRVAVATFWDEWASRYPTLNATRQWELQAELAGIIDAARARSVVIYAGTIANDPTVTPPVLNWPRQTIIQQVDGSGVYVALWWKTGDDINEWTLLGSGGGGPGTDRLVAADDGDIAPDVLINKLESDGSILITLDTEASPETMGLSRLYNSLMGDTL